MTSTTSSGLRVSRLILGAAVLLAALSYGHPSAVAHEGAKGVVKERMDAMKALAADMKVLGGMLSGRTKYDAVKAGAAARSIGRHADTLPSKFPAGSTANPSQSKPEVWSRRTEFDASFAELRQLATRLEVSAGLANSAAGGPSEIIRQISRNCSACHKVYRKPEHANH